MPVYQYQAINEQGHQIQGTYIESKAKVLEILKKKIVILLVFMKYKARILVFKTF